MNETGSLRADAPVGSTGAPIGASEVQDERVWGVGWGGWGEGGGELPETVEMLRFIFHHLNFCSAPDLIIVI